jgi:hypothetical protein
MTRVAPSGSTPKVELRADPIIASEASIKRPLDSSNVRYAAGSRGPVRRQGQPRDASLGGDDVADRTRESWELAALDRNGHAEFPRIVRSVDDLPSAVADREFRPEVPWSAVLEHSARREAEIRLAEFEGCLAGAVGHLIQGGRERRDFIARGVAVLCARPDIELDAELDLE